MSNTFVKQESKLILSFGYNKEIVDAIKELDYKDRSWDPIGKHWTLRTSVLNVNRIKAIIERFGFTQIAASEVKDDISSYLAKKSRMNIVRSFRSDMEKMKTGINLYEYQIEGIDRMCSWDKMINGDDMGLGKSYQTIYAAEIRDRFPCLLVCPSSTKYQWAEFWRRINPSRTTYIVESGSEPRWDADVTIINYDMLGNKEKYEDRDGNEKVRFVPRFRELTSKNWKYVCFDEIHYAKNYKTVRGHLCRAIAKGVESVHGLTGTIVENKPVELVNPLMIIDMFVEVFGTWDNFVTRYCDLNETRFGKDVSGASNTLELNRLMRETCYIRREKRDVLKNLPPVQESILNIDLTNEKEYRKAEDNFIDYLTENFSRITVDNAIMAEVLVQRNHLRQLSLKGKLKGISDWLEDFAEQSKEKVLIVGNFTEPMEKLSIEFNGDLLNGAMGAKEKRESILRWNKDDRQFIFGNCKAIGTGTDGLQEKCSTIVVIDLPDKPSTLEQTISRLERIGQKNSVFVYYLLNRDTIDMKIWDMIQAKKKVTEAINKGKNFTPINSDEMIIKSYLKRV